jgi:hypothetical protein
MSTLATLSTDLCARFTNIATGHVEVCELPVTALAVDGGDPDSAFVGGIDGRVYALSRDAVAIPVSDMGPPITAISIVQRPRMMYRYMAIGRLDGTVDILCYSKAGNATSVIAVHTHRHDSPVRHIVADATRVVSIDTMGRLVVSGLVMDTDPWFDHQLPGPSTAILMCTSRLAVGHAGGVHILNFGADGAVRRKLRGGGPKLLAM